MTQSLSRPTPRPFSYRALAAWSSVCLAGCSAGPLPSIDDRQSDDVNQPPAAQNASVARLSVPAATTARKPSTARSSATGNATHSANSAPQQLDAAADVDAASLDATPADVAADDAGPAQMDPDSGERTPTSISQDARVADRTVSKALEDSATSESQAPDAGPAPPFGETICPPSPLAGFHYAQGNEFWLGDQLETPLRLQGYGYFAARNANSEIPTYHYSKALALSVGPDGTLEDHAGYAVLGYATGQPVGGCLTPLRAPIGLPASATTEFGVAMNFDARSDIADTPFDKLNPTTSIISPPISVPCFDGDGHAHRLEVYFEHVAVGTFRYHVLAASDDLVPEAVGLEELGSGDLLFDAVGALLAETSPPICTSFFAASTYQCFTFDFGSSIRDDGASGTEGSTSLVGATTVAEITNDGFSAGTSTRLSVDQQGVVTVLIDNGQSVAIGALTVARFPSEDQLEPAGGAAFRETIASGPPAFGAPLGPGRGSVVR